MISLGCCLPQPGGNRTHGSSWEREGRLEGGGGGGRGEGERGEGGEEGREEGKERKGG